MTANPQQDRSMATSRVRTLMWLLMGVVGEKESCNKKKHFKYITGLKEYFIHPAFHSHLTKEVLVQENFLLSRIKPISRPKSINAVTNDTE